MISAVVIVKNEERVIGDCLKSLSFCDEIIVIDDKSSDKTVEIAKKHKAVVYEHDLGNDFASQRNFGLKKAKEDWVLFIDADEIVSDDLQNEILNSIQKENAEAFYIPREDFLFGKKLRFGDAGTVSILRLARREAGNWEGNVHEIWKINRKKVRYLKKPILHYPHQSIAEFLKEINVYSTIRAKELQNKKESSNVATIILYPKLKFIYLYVFKLGFFDGTAGIVHALMMSFYSFLVRSKLFLLSHGKH